MRTVFCLIFITLLCASCEQNTTSEKTVKEKPTTEKAITESPTKKSTTEKIDEHWVGSYKLDLMTEIRIADQDSTVSGKSEPFIVSISKDDDYTITLYNVNNKQGQWDIKGQQRGGIIYLKGTSAAEENSVLGEGKITGMIYRQGESIKVELEEVNEPMLDIVRNTSTTSEELKVPMKVTIKKQGLGVRIGV